MSQENTVYQNSLQEMLARVREELSTLGIHNPENSADWIATPEVQEGEADANIAADRVEDWDERRSTLATLERQYNDVTRALSKIEDGTYGICEIGGEAIEEERLRANPAARTCTQHLEEETSLSG